MAEGTGCGPHYTNTVAGRDHCRPPGGYIVHNLHLQRDLGDTHTTDNYNHSSPVVIIFNKTTIIARLFLRDSLDSTGGRYNVCLLLLLLAQQLCISW